MPGDGRTGRVRASDPIHHAVGTTKERSAEAPARACSPASVVRPTPTWA